jgi:hypothetical protein
MIAPGICPKILIYLRITLADLSQVFGIFCFAFGPVVYLFYPETANRTLEDMDQIFIQNPSAFVFTDRAATQSKRPDVLIEAEMARIAQIANKPQETTLSGNEKNATGTNV